MFLGERFFCLTNVDECVAILKHKLYLKQTCSMLVAFQCEMENKFILSSLECVFFLILKQINNLKINFLALKIFYSKILKIKLKQTQKNNNFSIIINF